MGLTRVVMRLGRNPDAGFPEGNDDHGYVVVAPLDKDGKLDLELWRANKEKCTVDRVLAGSGREGRWLALTPRVPLVFPL